jgi:hemoglobin-like flavoprotein
MTAHEITAVRNSFRHLAPIADQAAALFYARLFELDPSLRQLFHGDMQTQGRKLFQLIGAALASLDETGEIASGIRQVDAVNADIGVRGEHFATISAALIWTLEKSLGSQFTPEARSAWKIAASQLAAAAKGGAPVGANAT